MLLLVSTLSGCGPSAEERAAQIKAEHERRAEILLESFDRAVKEENWHLAIVQAQAIQNDAPRSDAATNMKALMESMLEKARLQTIRQRMENLWTYQIEWVDGESTPQKTADIYNSIEGEASKESPRVRLILRRHPQWGESFYLVSRQGNFRCVDPCKFTIQFDAKAAQEFDGTISSTGTEPAYFIEDEKRFIEGLKGAAIVRIRDNQPQPVELFYEVSGFSPTRYSRGR